MAEFGILAGGTRGSDCNFVNFQDPFQSSVVLGGRGEIDQIALLSLFEKGDKKDNYLVNKFC